VDISHKNNPEDSDRDVWPDERVAEKRETGSSDPYLAELAQQGRDTAMETSCPTPFESRGWAGEERRDRSVDSFDPYVVELTRPGRSLI
jgi:hypothetical protein